METPAPRPAQADARLPLLSLEGISKRFGTVVANDDVSFAVAPGEVHALLGENGAGKSTLVKILYGMLAPDSGAIRLDGQPLAIASPAEARRLGIGMIFQHFALFEALTVAENVAVSLDGEVPGPALAKRIRDVSATYGLPVDPRRTVATMSVGERQRVEIVRCLLQEPRLLVMDEPTSVLTPQEADRLFETLARLTAEGVSVLYITHRLDEVTAIASAATVLRRGRVVARLDPRTETSASLARAMVGSALAEIEARRSAAPGPVRLRLAGLSLPPEEETGVALDDVELEVRGGEIVAVAGVAGNGQGELFAAVSGERLAPSPGMVAIDGTEVGGRGIDARRRLGGAFVPEERTGHSAAPGFSLVENVVLSRHGTDRGLVGLGGIDMKQAEATEARVAGAFDVRRAGPSAFASELSGGNLQKFVVGREIDRAPGVLVVNQPTWGVDAAAARRVHSALVGLADSGAAVLVISQDLDEVFALADRIAVISRGRLSAPVAQAETSREAVGLLMGGADAH